MRRLFLSLAILVAACGRFGGGGGQAVTHTVIVPPDTALSVAAATLTAEGWTVNRLVDGSIATAPRPVPASAQTVAAGGAEQQWMLQVAARPLLRVRGTEVSVVGYVIPPAASRPVDTTMVSRAVPITSFNAKLWPQVRATADRIHRAIRAKRG